MKKSESAGAVARTRRLPGFAAGIALALALAGCDGGDTPSLAIEADSTTTAAGGASVALHAQVGGGSDAPTWSLSGPGSLSATTGLAVTYTPPDAESFDVAGTATITATSGDLAQSTQITLTAVSVPGHHWDTAREAAQAWGSATFADGLFVVTGANDGIATSRDGIAWTHHDTVGGHDWVSAAYGAAGWVAIDYGGQVMRSADGSAWSTPVQLPEAAGQEFIGGLAAGSGLYVAVGNANSYVSADGVNWTTIAQPFGSIAFGNGRFCATISPLDLTTSDTVYTSTDGVHWTAAADAPAGMVTLAFGNGMFLASGSSANATSTDGIHWTTYDISVAVYPTNPLSYVAGAFYSTPGYALFATTDGQAWTQVLPFGNGLTVSGPLAAGDGTVVMALDSGELRSGATVASLTQAVAPSGGRLIAADYVNGRYFAVSRDGVAVTSTDGRNWTSARLQTGNPLLDVVTVGGVAHAPDGTIVVAGRYDNTVIGIDGTAPAFFTSTNARDWTTTSPPGVHFNDELEAEAIVHDGLRFVSVSDAGKVYASANGLDWTQAGTIAGLHHVTTALAFGGGRYVGVGYGGQAATSTDAVNWTTAPAVMNGDTALNLSAIAYDGRRFVAVGDDGMVATSTDGLAWSVASTAVTTHLYGIAASPGGELVAVGGSHDVIESSADGVTWTLRTPGKPTSLYGISAIDGGFMAVGEDGLIEFSTH